MTVYCQAGPLAPVGLVACIAVLASGAKAGPDRCDPPVAVGGINASTAIWSGAICWGAQPGWWNPAHGDQGQELWRHEEMFRPLMGQGHNRQQGP